MEKAAALSKSPFLAIEPPLVRLGAICDDLRDFFAQRIENPHREIPDEMSERFRDHGLSFLSSARLI
jgi:hypothetical protein